MSVRYCPSCGLVRFSKGVCRWCGWRAPTPAPAEKIYEVTLTYRVTATSASAALEAVEIGLAGKPVGEVVEEFDG